MKFVFEAKASDYDLAAEQEILLRHVSNRKRNWTRAVILCAATVVLCVLIVVFRHKDMTETVQVAALVVGVILFQQGYLDYTSGNPKAFLKLLYRGRRDQTYADLNKVLRIEITEDSPAVEIYNEDGKAGEWDFQNLNRVTESDRIFELCRGGGHSSPRTRSARARSRSSAAAWIAGSRAIRPWNTTTFPSAAKSSS